MRDGKGIALVMEGIENPNKPQTENIAEVQMELFIHGTRLNRTV